MRLDFAVLARAAQATGGELFLFGGALRSIGVPVIPAAIPLTVVARLEADTDEAGMNHTLGVRGYVPNQTNPYFDPPGLSFTVGVEGPADPNDPVISILSVMNVGLVPVIVEGRYRYEILLDSEVVADLPLSIRLTGEQNIVGPEEGTGVRTVQRSSHTTHHLTAPGTGPRVSVYRDQDGAWRWRAREANNRIAAQSAEGYTDRGRAIEDAHMLFPLAEIHDE